MRMNICIWIYLIWKIKLIGFRRLRVDWKVRRKSISGIHIGVVQPKSTNTTNTMKRRMSLPSLSLKKLSTLRLRLKEKLSRSKKKNKKWKKSFKIFIAKLTGWWFKIQGYKPRIVVVEVLKSHFDKCSKAAHRPPTWKAQWLIFSQQNNQW